MFHSFAREWTAERCTRGGKRKFFLSRTCVCSPPKKGSSSKSTVDNSCACVKEARPPLIPKPHDNHLNYFLPSPSAAAKQHVSKVPNSCCSASSRAPRPPLRLCRLPDTPCEATAATTLAAILEGLSAYLERLRKRTLGAAAVAVATPPPPPAASTASAASTAEASTATTQTAAAVSVAVPPPPPLLRCGKPEGKRRGGGGEGTINQRQHHNGLLLQRRKLLARARYSQVLSWLYILSSTRVRRLRTVRVHNESRNSDIEKRNNSLSFMCIESARKKRCSHRSENNRQKITFAPLSTLRAFVYGTLTYSNDIE